MNPRPRESYPPYSEDQREVSTNLLQGHEPPLMQEPVFAQAAAVQTPMAAQAIPAEALLPPTVPYNEKKKIPRIRFKN